MINNLIIETTRSCNMSCEHCLRGKSEHLTMSTSHIITLAEQLSNTHVSSICFSGGEPSLVPDVIEHTIAAFSLHNVTIDSFYIATNGLNVPVEFILACLRLYAFCGEKEYCSLEVSNDFYHAEQDSYSTELLDGLAFFRRKFANEASHNFICLNEGNYEEYYGDSERTPDSVEITSYESLDEVDFYLNCHGQLINGCDWSYTNQPEHIICHVSELSSFVTNLRKEYILCGK